MKLKDILKTLDNRTLVRVEYMSMVIITTRAGSWRCLDDALLNTPVAACECSMDDHHNDAATIRLLTDIPVYVSTAAELQTAMDSDKIHAVALAADIRADDDVATLLTYSSPQVKSLDLNGFMLAAANVETENAVTAIRVENGTLNIYDSQGCGEVFGGKYSAAGNYALDVWAGMANIYGGFFTAAGMNQPDSSATIITDGGSVNIYEGIFENESYALNGVNAVLSGENITLYGGAVVNQNPADFTASGKHIEESMRYYDTFYRVVGK